MRSRIFRGAANARFLFFLGSALVTTCFGVAVPGLAGGPANDDFSEAIVIPDLVCGFTDFQDTTLATIQGIDPQGTCGSGGDAATVWYTSTSSEDCTASVGTCGSDYDTVLSVYTGSPGNFVQVACNDDKSILTGESELTFLQMGGVPYFIVVATFGDLPSGNLEFQYCCESIFSCGERLVTFDIDQAGAPLVAGTEVTGTVLQDLGIVLSGQSDAGTPGVFVNRPTPGTDTGDLSPVTGNYLTTLADPDNLEESDSGVICIDFVDPSSHLPRTIEFAQLAFLDVEGSTSVMTAFSGSGCTGEVLFQATTGAPDPERMGGRILVEVGAVGSGASIASIELRVGSVADSAAVDHLCFAYTSTGLALLSDGGGASALEVSPGDDFFIDVRAMNQGESRFPGVFLTYVVRHAEDPYFHPVRILTDRHIALPAGVDVTTTLRYRIPKRWGENHLGERLSFGQILCTRSLFVQEGDSVDVVIVP